MTLLPNVHTNGTVYQYQYQYQLYILRALNELLQVLPR